jgi:hypothetical protein
MGKCAFCGSTKKIRKITVPIERRGKIVNYRKVMVCPGCLVKHYPEFATENTLGEMEPRTYDMMIRGKKVKIRGRDV